MPKYEKDRMKKSGSRESQGFNDEFAFRSLIITTIIGIMSFIISVFFNVAEIFSYLAGQNRLLILIDIIIRIVVILSFFFFMMVSFGNYKDLLGKPSNWKDILFLFLLSLLQTIRNVYVFGFTLAGLILLLFYLYLIQEG